MSLRNHVQTAVYVAPYGELAGECGAGLFAPHARRREDARQQRQRRITLINLPGKNGFGCRRLVENHHVAVEQHDVIARLVLERVELLELIAPCVTRVSWYDTNSRVRAIDRFPCLEIGIAGNVKDHVLGVDARE